MFDRIQILKEKGYFPDTILDIGAHHGVWTNTMKQLYNCNYYLFEANDYSGMIHYHDPLFNVVLSDKIEEVDFYQIYGTGDSFFKEKTKHYTNCISVKRTTIDLNTLISQTNILQNSKNIFIKIDCQGAEIPILKGATAILDKTDFIILEVPLFGKFNENVPTFLEHISFMDSIGFTIYDIIDKHYLNQFNFQADILFINKNHPFNGVTY